MLTADQLGMPQRAYDSLLAVRADMVAGAFRSYRGASDFSRNAPPERVLNMGSALYAGATGAGRGGRVACAVGWAALHMLGFYDAEVPRERLSEVHATVGVLSGVLDSLFCPRGVPRAKWSYITVAECAASIDALLERGAADWASATRRLAS